MKLTDQDSHRIDYYLRLSYRWSNFLRFLLNFLELDFKKLLNFQKLK